MILLFELFENWLHVNRYRIWGPCGKNQMSENRRRVLLGQKYSSEPGKSISLLNGMCTNGMSGWETLTGPWASLEQ